MEMFGIFCCFMSCLKNLFLKKKYKIKACRYLNGKIGKNHCKKNCYQRSKQLFFQIPKTKTMTVQRLLSTIKNKTVGQFYLSSFFLKLIVLGNFQCYKSSCVNLVKTLLRRINNTVLYYSTGLSRLSKSQDIFLCVWLWTPCVLLFVQFYGIQFDDIFGNCFKALNQTARNNVFTVCQLFQSFQQTWFRQDKYTDL